MEEDMAIDAGAEREETQEDGARAGASPVEAGEGPLPRDASDRAERSDSDDDRRGSRGRDRRGHFDGDRREIRRSRERSRGSRERSRGDSRETQRRQSWGADRRDSPECDPYSIYLGGLSYDSDEAAIRSVFEEFGEVKNIKMIYDRYTGLPRGFCFVTFTTTRAAEIAIEEMDGQVVDGRTIRVSKVVKPHQGPGGGGFRRGFAEDRGRWESSRHWEREEAEYGAPGADRDSPEARGGRSYLGRSEGRTVRGGSNSRDASLSPARRPRRKRGRSSDEEEDEEVERVRRRAARSTRKGGGRARGLDSSSAGDSGDEERGGKEGKEGEVGVPGTGRSRRGGGKKGGAPASRGRSESPEGEPLGKGEEGGGEEGAVGKAREAPKGAGRKGGGVGRQGRGGGSGSESDGAEFKTKDARKGAGEDEDMQDSDGDQQGEEGKVGGAGRLPRGGGSGSLSPVGRRRAPKYPSDREQEDEDEEEDEEEEGGGGGKVPGRKGGPGGGSLSPVGRRRAPKYPSDREQEEEEEEGEEGGVAGKRGPGVGSLSPVGRTRAPKYPSDSEEDDSRRKEEEGRVGVAARGGGAGAQGNGRSVRHAGGGKTGPGAGLVGARHKGEEEDEEEEESSEEEEEEGDVRGRLAATRPPSSRVAGDLLRGSRGGVEASTRPKLGAPRGERYASEEDEAEQEEDEGGRGLSGSGSGRGGGGGRGRGGVSSSKAQRAAAREDVTDSDEDDGKGRPTQLRDSMGSRRAFTAGRGQPGRGGIQPGRGGALKTEVDSEEEEDRKREDKVASLEEALRASQKREALLSERVKSLEQSKRWSAAQLSHRTNALLQILNAASRAQKAQLDAKQAESELQTLVAGLLPSLEGGVGEPASPASQMMEHGTPALPLTANGTDGMESHAEMAE